jgi:hypothetical protein
MPAPAPIGRRVLVADDNPDAAVEQSRSWRQFSYERTARLEGFVYFFLCRRPV